VGSLLATPIPEPFGVPIDLDESLTSTNPESNRYVYPVCPAWAGPSIIPNPDSKVQ
jgi:hypothetical protein